MFETAAVRDASSAEDDQFSGTHHVYQPFRAGLPQMGPYLRELWRRREFAVEASRASIRATQANTLFGQIWNILNPLLLAGVYYVLVYIIRGGGRLKPELFPHMLCGLFVFYFISNSMSGGATSVVSAGKMIMNTAFPRALLPLSSVRTSVRQFLPTLVITAIAVGLSPVKFSWVLVYTLPWFCLIVLFAAGMSLLMATSQVYFRDTSSFLPYVMRIWLYTSPVLWFADEVPAKLRPLEIINPLFSLIGGWQEIIIQHHVPPPSVWLTAIAWSVAAFLLGGFVFLSRERDFAVRL